MYWVYMTRFWQQAASGVAYVSRAQQLLHVRSEATLQISKRELPLARAESVMLVVPLGKLI